MPTSTSPAMTDMTRERTDTLFALRGVSVRYPGAQQAALEGLSVEIKAGELVGVVGPTGCGKTTFLHVLAGVIPHYTRANLEGEVLLAGRDTRELSFRKTSARTGLMLQDPEAQLFNLLVRDEIVWGLENRGLGRPEMAGRLEEALESFAIRHLRDRVTYDLSGGEKQRVALASIYALKPGVILFDAPTSQLDPIGAANVIEAVRRLASTGLFTIVIVEDNIDQLLENVHRVLVMERGTFVFDGSPREFCEARDIRSRVGLQASQVAELFYAVTDGGLPYGRVPVTVEEATATLGELIRSRSVPVSPGPAVPAERQASDPAPGAPLVTVEGVSFTYPPPRSIRALDPVDLTFRRGEFVAIVGRNGSGKTTLARCLTGHLEPTRGRVLVDGQEIARLPPSRRARKAGYVFQNPDHQLFTQSVWEEVAFGLQNVGMPSEDVHRRVAEILAAVELDSKADLHPFQLSRGDRQRLAVAAVAVLRPQMLIIDEPTTGQDPVKAREILDLLRRLNRDEGACIVIISHAMDLVAEYARRTIVLADGRLLLDGPTRDVFSRPDVLARSSVTPPPVTRLALSLGISPPPVTVPEAREAILTRMRG